MLLYFFFLVKLTTMKMKKSLTSHLMLFINELLLFSHDFPILFCAYIFSVISSTLFLASSYVLKKKLLRNRKFVSLSSLSIFAISRLIFHTLFFCHTSKKTTIHLKRIELRKIKYTNTLKIKQVKATHEQKQQQQQAFCIK